MRNIISYSMQPSPRGMRGHDIKTNLTLLSVNMIPCELSNLITVNRLMKRYFLMHFQENWFDIPN